MLELVVHHGVMSGERGGIQQGAKAYNRLRCERLASLVTGAGLPRFLEGREMAKEQTVKAGLPFLKKEEAERRHISTLDYR